MSVAILAQDLTKSFNDGQSFALQGVNIQIQQGEFVAIIGLSGAGKSTFLRSINGTHSLTRGTLNVLGIDVGKLGDGGLVPLRKQIGFIFQQFNLVKNLSAIKNVLCGRVAFVPLWRSLSGFYSKQDMQLAKDTLDSVGLHGRYYDKVRNLSGGQQQRVAIARALVQEPKIILADEPMASLDPKLSEVVLDILSRVNRERGITVLVNIHVLELAKKYASRMLAFRQGQLVFDGSPALLTQEKLDGIYYLDKMGGLS